MPYRIDYDKNDRKVIFNLTPPYSLLWGDDRVYCRVIELCFICYTVYQRNWCHYIADFIYRYIDTEFSEEMSNGYAHIVTDIVDEVLAKIRSKESDYTQGIEDVLGYFNPELLSHLELRCVPRQPIIEVTLPGIKHV